MFLNKIKELKNKIENLNLSNKTMALIVLLYVFVGVPLLVFIIDFILGIKYVMLFLVICLLGLMLYAKRAGKHYEK